MPRSFDDYYRNFGEANTTGSETELQARWSDYGGFINLSYAKPTGNTTADFLSGKATATASHPDPGDDYLGYAKVKASVGGYLKLGHTAWSPTISYLGNRQVQTKASALIQDDGGPFPYWSESISSVLLVNLTMIWTTPVPYLQLRFMLHNVGNTKYLMPQPYYGEHAPLPVGDRMISIEANWKF